MEAQIEMKWVVINPVNGRVVNQGKSKYRTVRNCTGLKKAEISKLVEGHIFTFSGKYEKPTHYLLKRMPWYGK